jgi:hypothetical protein
LVAVVLAAVWLPQVPAIQRGAPWRASAALDALPGRAHVLNQYTLGSWIIWTARDTSPAIDGRTEIYSPEYVTKALGVVGLSPGWKRFIRHQHFDAVWLYKGAPLISALRELGWTTYFHDADSVILVPPIS